MAEYLEVRDSGQHVLVPLESERITIGSDPHNTVSVRDAQVSSLHAVLERYPAGWAVRDLGSRNGTFVNGEQIWAERRLVAGDEIRLGTTRILFRGDRPARQTIAARRPPELTRRERDILVSLCKPLLAVSAFTEPASIRQIAEDLVVSEAAVKKHLQRLYDKFEIHEGERRRVLLANDAIQRGAVGLADLTGS
jgi:pSer/pThr/pTyr-binding forkhead associated (FHA) protein